MHQLKIKELLQDFFSSTKVSGEKRHIVFWYDEEKTYEEHINELTPDNVKIHILTEKNNFITKITGRGEIPINKMPGFHPPNNEEHEYILQRVEKNLKKEITTSVLWLIISLIISVFYLYMYITSNVDNKKYMLIASAVFFIISKAK